MLAELGRQPARGRRPRRPALGRRGHARPGQVPRPPHPAGRRPPRPDLSRRRAAARATRCGSCSATWPPRGAVRRVPLPAAVARGGAHARRGPLARRRPRCTVGPAATRSSSPRCWPAARQASRPPSATPCWHGPRACRPAGRAALDAAAVIGAQVEPWLLDALVDDAARAAEECMAVGMLWSRASGSAFRHELARQAILDTIAPPRRRALHARALRRPGPRRRAGPISPASPTTREGADDARAVLAHAPAAAARAAATGRAPRGGGPVRPRPALRRGVRRPPERARLLDALRRRVHARRPARRGDRRVPRGRSTSTGRSATGSGPARAWPSVAKVLVARRAQRRGRGGEPARHRNAPASLPPGPALALRVPRPGEPPDAQPRPRRGRPVGPQGDRARGPLRRAGDTLIAGYNTVGAAMLVYGDDRGRAHLEHSLALAREGGLPDLDRGPPSSTSARRAARCTGSRTPTATCGGHRARRPSATSTTPRTTCRRGWR